jgi:oxygen-independent coproporphyrinogen-3 oxidase
VQSFHEPTLRWMGRLHGPEGARAALSRTLDTGFRSATADLIFGVPAALDRPWQADLDLIAASGVPHVSLYGLTVEPGTPLSRSVAEGRTPPVDHVQYEEEYLEAAERLVGEGYEHYEVSSFARPGHRSAHNQGYWSGVPYLGLGNGAHTFVPPVRSWNVRAWPEYRDLVATGAPPRLEAETVDGDKARLENIWLGLRCQEGLATTSLDSDRIAAWVRAGHAQQSDGRVRLTSRGWLLLDQLAVEASSDPVPVPVPDSSKFATSG